MTADAEPPRAGRTVAIILRSNGAGVVGPRQSVERALAELPFDGAADGVEGRCRGKRSAAASSSPSGVG